MDFTDAQRDAIETRGCSLLVAAGAGSGKTRVLTERIVGMLTDPDEKADIAGFLVVTFTNAAAREMVDRIRKTLTARLKTAKNRDETDRLLRALALLPTASVCTIDSFCLDLARTHFEKLRISPRSRVAMKNETDVLLRRAIDEVIEEKMGETAESPYFLTVYELYAGRRSDKPFAETLFMLYRHLETQPSFDSYFDTALSYYRKIADGFGYDSFYGGALLGLYDDVMTRSCKELEKAAELCKTDEALMKNYYPAVENNLSCVRRYLSSPHTSYTEDVKLYDALGIGRVSLKAASRADPALKEYVKQLNTDAKDRVSEFMKQYYTTPGETLKKCAEDMCRIISELCDLIRRIDDRFTAAKQRLGMIEFADAEHFALRLVTDKSDGAAPELNARYSHIFIDEYQDINPVQDRLFSAIARRDGEGREYNRFLVGDSKQSIYGFRGARPDIFMGYRSRFSPIDDTSSPSRKIFMQHNFRCAEPVIAFTNHVFSRLMPEEYTDTDALIFAKREECPVKAPVKLIVCGVAKDGKRSTVDMRREAEMRVTAEQIRGLVGKADIVGENGRPYTYADITVLTGKWKQAVALEKYLRDVGIPAWCNHGELLFSRLEVRFVVNVLKAVDNPERDIPLCVFAGCAVGGLTDNDLAAVRANRRSGSLYHALRDAAEGKIRDTALIDEKLREKCASFLTLLASLREKARRMSAFAFLRALYAEIDPKSLCASERYANSATDTPAVRQKNLGRLTEIARDFERGAYHSLSDFLDYIEGMYNDDAVKSAGEQSGACVTVTTIHQSKGLEYPVCIVFGLGEKGETTKATLVYSERFGMASQLRDLPLVTCMAGNSGHMSTQRQPFRDLLLALEKRQTEAETKRVLYVAATRARDRLILTACVDDPVKTVRKALDFPEKCLYDDDDRAGWLLGSLSGSRQLAEAAESIGVLPTEPYGKRAYEDLPFVELSVSVVPPSEGERTAEDEPSDNGIDFEPDAADMAWLADVKNELAERARASASFAGLPPKLTVSQLKHGLLEYEDMETATADARQLRTSPLFTEDGETAAGSEKGTAMHQFLQFADYAHCETAGAEAEADRLTEEGYITRKQAGLLDIPTLDAFFRTPLYARIRSSEEVNRELRFNLRVAAEDVVKNAPQSDDFVLVQGVIDCFFKNPDGSYTVVDFKTDRVGKDGEKVLVERYRQQLRYYARAVCEITECDVSEAVLFSFARMAEIPVDVSDVSKRATTRSTDT